MLCLRIATAAPVKPQIPNAVLSAKVVQPTEPSMPVLLRDALTAIEEYNVAYRLERAQALKAARMMHEASIQTQRRRMRRSLPVARPPLPLSSNSVSKINTLGSSDAPNMSSYTSVKLGFTAAMNTEYPQANSSPIVSRLHNSSKNINNRTCPVLAALPKTSSTVNQTIRQLQMNARHQTATPSKKRGEPFLRSLTFDAHKY